MTFKELIRDVTEYRGSGELSVDLCQQSALPIDPFTHSSHSPAGHSEDSPELG